MVISLEEVRKSRDDAKLLLVELNKTVKDREERLKEANRQVEVLVEGE